MPKGSPAIVLEVKATAATAGSSPEAFKIQTKNLNGHPSVVLGAKYAVGLKHAVQELIIRSEQRFPGLEITQIDISETPRIPSVNGHYVAGLRNWYAEVLKIRMPING